MRRLKNLPVLLLGLLLIASAIGYYATRDAEIARPATKATNPGQQASLMDQRLLQTARQMAATAETADERAFAEEAARLADHELDQAFATALREAATEAASLGPALQKQAARVAQMKAKVAREQDRVNQLTKDQPDSSALDLAKAQLALDQDELDDAQGDLARQGGDPHASIERALQEHEAAQKVAVEPARATAASPSTIAGYVRLWLALGERMDNAEAARQQAAAKAASLVRQHDALEKSKAPAPDPDDEEDTAAVVERLRKLSDQTKTMRELDARTQDTQQLAAVYQKWEAELETRRRSTAHELLRGLALVFAVLLGGFFIAGAVQRAILRHGERRRAHQLRFMARLALQLITAGVVLLLVFGPPTQLSTMIGLATAGLTVVLKDFVVAFFGWFVLIGKHGLRVGDWVEIDGISGEVIEIGVLRTVIIEVGSSSSSRPTGRRVGFMNSFAIEGKYFNFSTTGQWFWDEIRVTVPPGGDPYAVAEEIRETVERATEADTEEAAQDWERATRQYGTRPFSAHPTVDLQPGSLGLEVKVRYLTRAHERGERKSRLLQDIVGLLHRGMSGASAPTV